MALLVPLHRLIVPLWPDAVYERLDPAQRPVLVLEAGVDEADPVRSRPISAAVVDRTDGQRQLGYVVALRRVDGSTVRPPPDGYWWPALDEPGCELGLSIERTVHWVDCADVQRVHHPNRLTTFSRFRVALDRLFGGPRIADRHETATVAG